MKYLWGFILLSGILGIGNSAKILLLSTVPSPSHSLLFNKLATLLAPRGHQVVIIDTTDKVKSKAPNVTHIIFDGAFDHGIDLSELGNFAKEESAKYTIDILPTFFENSCTNMINSRQARQFLNRYKEEEKPFDLIIHDGIGCECFLGFVHVFGNPPLIEFTTFGDPTILLHFMGQYDNPTYVPLVMSPHHSLSFMDRFKNTLISLYEYYVIYYKHFPTMNRLAKEYYGSDVPLVQDIGKNTSLVILNSHFSLIGPKPILPSIIYVGGFHIGPPKPIPERIKKFLDEAKEGAILFSLGTNVLSSNIEESKFKMFIEVFKKIPQRVLWKFESNITTFPDNVMVSKWLPQSDILAHPNIRLFISHGGMLSTQEAIYHGVPVVGIPFMGDQFSNILRFEERGVGIKLDYNNLSADKLQKCIGAILNDQRYSNNMKEWSRTFKDGPETPQERMLFWIEYVLRHPNSELMRSPTQKMHIYQILMLDIILTLVLTLIVVIFVLRKTLSCLLYIFCKKNKKQKIS